MNNLTKKFLSIALITIMTMCLFIGCVQKKTKATKKIKIGVCMANLNNKYIYYLFEEMRNYAKSLNNVEVILVDAKLNSNTQLSQVKDFISQKVDTIVVNPITTYETKPITDQAKAANVPIISLMIPFANQDDAVCFVAPDSKHASMIEMEYLAKKMNYKGNVAIIMGPIGDEAQNLRTETYHEIIAKYPDMKIVAEEIADWNRARAMAVMQTWLESNKDIDVVVANNDEMAIGALKAIEAAGKLGKITVGGMDATPDTLAYLKSGKLSVTSFQDPKKLAQYSINTAVAAANGKNIEKIILVQNELVTPENVDKYMAKWNNKKD